ncbi:TrmB family transcriptional regulator [Nitrococcus mobilis]|uniref:Putative transcriptional regulator n=1 Tax=Nitrococcus mobilis Nb-231 TaxID=314278 RepID=A4BTK4_9GAMM|nr:TrmB family transcriptional regulator [Nitrococcus mobilis]EAR20960.1 putative transcriptional regulator [Nitrococcus mobilis Nb-231]
MEITLALQKLGFSEYEARAYVALAQGSSLNGYETARDAGLPRANIYPVLEKLVQRGAARRFETRDGNRYTATLPERLLEHIEAGQRRTLTSARRALATLRVPAEVPAIFNLSGRGEFLSQAESLIESTRNTLLVAIQPPEATALAALLDEARARGVVITTLCMESCPTECGGCQGDIYRYNLAPPGAARWCLLVADATRMLAAAACETEVNAMLTEQPLIVELASAYIRQSLALATLGGAFGECFEGLLSVEARCILDSLYPENGFLAYIKRLAQEPN